MTCYSWDSTLGDTNRCASTNPLFQFFLKQFGAVLGPVVKFQVLHPSTGFGGDLSPVSVRLVDHKKVPGQLTLGELELFPVELLAVLPQIPEMVSSRVRQVGGSLLRRAPIIGVTNQGPYDQSSEFRFGILGKDSTNFGGPPKTVASGGGKHRYQPHPVQAAVESGDHLLPIKGNRRD